MTQPTKEQVLKRMAEIESWQSDERKEGVVYYDSCGDAVDPIDTPSDWAMLIEKHEMAVWKEGNHWWAVTKELEDIPLKEQCNPSLPWAICLAIIESKGGMGDE